MAASSKQYPPPLASHEDVVSDSVVFWDKLRRFHSLMGTKFMIPVIGGRELDLHVLYVEATKRGGYEKVVAEKKWREVGTVFKFSATTTSASFVLRKHYFNLLYHFEQVHFFHLQGPLSTPSATFPGGGGSPSSSRPEMSVEEYSPEPIRYCLTPPPLTNPGEGSSTFQAIGTIDGKCDVGYLVSVRLGSEILKGVLYHPYHPQPDMSSTTNNQNESNVLIPSARNRRGRIRKRRRNRRAFDPNHPKPNRSGYNFFFAEEHNKLKSLYPNREREFTKIIGQSWNKLSPEERMVYQNIGLKDKERYRRELKEYKEKMKLVEVQRANC